jgi:ABC-type transporter Mla subunit MlaD
VSRVVPGLLLLAAVAALTVVLTSGGGSDRELVIESPTATWMMPGLQVRDAGAVVGHVVSAQPTRLGTARVVVEIDDPAIWPLPVGTHAQYRWAGTIAFTNRYVQLIAPKPDGRRLRSGSVLTGRDVTQSVEFDQLFGIFDAGTRAQLKTMLDEGGPALADASPGLAGTLRNAPAALAQARLALAELGSDPAELSTLITSTGAIVHAIQSSNPGVDSLVSGAASTLAATASDATALGQSLHELPATLADVKDTLRRADPTLTSADAVLKRVSPGVRSVIALAPGLDTLLRTVVQVGPNAEQTLVDLRAAVPSLNPLLSKAQSLMPEFQTIGRLGATELNCIRPYAPEAAGLASTWDGFIQYGDGHDKYARVSGGVYPYPLSENPISSADVVKLFPALHYVFPAPPGEVAGQPWFNSACGVGPGSLNATDDPESAK